MLLENKTIVIMGLRNKWSIAWGAAISAKEQGANIIFSYRKEEDSKKIQALVDQIEGAKAYPCDVSKDCEIEKFFENIKKEYQKIDGILYSIAHANTDDLRGDFIETSRDGYSHALDISAYAFISICRHAKEVLKEGSSVVALTHDGSQRVYEGYNIMGSAKAALEANIRYLSNELGSKKIRVNGISAGAIKTLSAKGIKDFDKMLTLVEQRAPIKENITIKQVGDVNTFLMSDLSKALTGQIIYADNGYHIKGS